MKKRYLIIFIFVLIILMVPVSIYFNCMKSKSISVSRDQKYIKSEEVGVNKVNNVQFKIDEEEVEEATEVQEDVKIEANVNEIKKSSVNNQSKTITNNNTSSNTVNNVTVPVIQPVVVSDVLETLTGKMTSYGPDCYGCSGRVSYGQDVRNGNIYYQDKTYGQVRIVAGDRKFKFGTIVRIKNSRVGGTILAVVLDRGSNVGIGKATMFDLLYTSNAEASKAGTSNNVTFEILRYGF